MKQVFHYCFFARRLMAFQQGYQAAKFPLRTFHHSACSKTQPMGLNCSCIASWKKKTQNQHNKKTTNTLFHSPPLLTYVFPSKQCCYLQWYMPLGGRDAGEDGRLIPGVIPGSSLCTRAALEAFLVLPINFVSRSIFN